MSAADEADSDPLRLRIDQSVQLTFRGSSLSSDGGLLLHLQFDDALGLTDMAAELPGLQGASDVTACENSLQARVC